MKRSVASGLIAGLFISAASLPAMPAAAQDNLTGRILTEICLPYVSRSQSFEKSIRAARDMKFRRPVEDRNTPLEEYASEVTLVSRDGVWRVKLEEGSVEYGDGEVYALSCSVSSSRASATELANLGRRAFRDDRYWSTDEGDTRQWERRNSDTDIRRLDASVREVAGDRPALVLRGLYF